MVSRCSLGGVVLLAICSFHVSASTLPAKPGPLDMALRDTWVRDHFPVGVSGLHVGTATPSKQQPVVIVLNSFDLVFRNEVPGKGLAIAGHKFAHGIYCHAPTELRVRLPGPGKTFTSTVGILDNPASQGGSIIFRVKTDSQELCASPVMHRGETGTDISADLQGATEFLMRVEDAGDGLASDQGVWGEVRVTLVDGTEVRLSDLTLQEGLRSERSNPTLPFSFLYDGQPSDTLLANWQFAETIDKTDPLKVRRERTYTDPRTGLVVQASLIEYTDYPTVEWTLTLRNTGEKDTPILEGIQSLDVHAPISANQSPVLHYIRGDSCTPDSFEPCAEEVSVGYVKRFACQGGRPTNGSFPYWNLATEAGGVIAVCGWPGQWSGLFERDANENLWIRAGQDRTHFRLRPGEQVRAPLSVLQFYVGDWIRGQNLWRRWMVAHNLPRPAGQLVPTHYGTCWSVDLHPDAQSELAVLEGYVREQIPLDFYFIDAGWYPGEGAWYQTTGTWEVDRQRFPKGIREVSDRAHAHDMQFVLWFEPERVASGTWLAENHPEWIIGGANGGLVNLGIPAAWDWIVNRIDALITSEGVDVYRQDFNIDPLAYWRSVDEEDRQGLTEIAHVDGYLRFWRELLRRHPQLWIDSCASGGRRNDLETMRLSVPLLRSDYFNEPESQQCHTYGLSLWLPYHGSGLGAKDSYWFRSCIFPASRVGWDSRKPDLDYAFLKRMIAEFRRVQPYLLSDFYPLTPYSLEKSAWVAWQFDDPEQGGGVVQAFRRAECSDNKLTVVLRGLDPGATYCLEDLENSATRRLTGRELMEQGLGITLAEQPSAAVIVYRRE